MATVAGVFPSVFPSTAMGGGKPKPFGHAGEGFSPPDSPPLTPSRSPTASPTRGYRQDED